MKNPYGEYSDFLFRKRFVAFTESEPIFSEFYNYLIMGLRPGSFFSGIFSNAPFCEVVGRAHPCWQMDHLKLLAVMQQNLLPREAKDVDAWIAMTVDARRVILARHYLVYDADEEFELSLTRALDIHEVKFY